MADPLLEQVGINAVSTIFISKFKWAFRHQPILDWGIDAHVETIAGEQLTGKLVALQIKCGQSWFKELANGNYVFYGEGRHRRYWANHSLPVFIILHDPEKDLTIWQKFEPSLTKDQTGERWSIEIPPTNILEPKFKPQFEAGIPSGREAYRRFMLVVDYKTIEECAKKQKGGCVRMVVGEWINKSLNMRNASIYFPENKGRKPDLIFDRWVPYSNINDFMALRFPWLNYRYNEAPEEQAGEYMAHHLDIEVNSLGRSVIAYERFIEEGAEPQNVRPPIGDDEVGSDDDFDEEAFQRAVDKDQS